MSALDGLSLDRSIGGLGTVIRSLDVAFDRSEGLRSVPAKLGRDRALAVSAVTHALAVLCLVMLYRTDLAGVVAVIGIASTAAVLAAEHWLAERVNLAFFQLNILVGFLVLATVWFGKQGW